jgi:hypothetical protein
MPAPVILWRVGNVICRSRTLDADQIEITLARDTEIFERAVFSDSHAASDYAIAKMYAYNAHVSPPVQDLPDDET